MPEKYFIKQYSFEQYQHGGVGYNDIETILQAHNYIPIEFPHQHQTGAWAKIKRLLFLFRSLRTIPAQSEIVFLFPVYAKIIQHFVHKLSRRKDIKLICIIGDIEGLRDNDAALLHTEKNTLKLFNYFIVHNDKMAEWLHHHIGPKTYATLHFFDFLSPIPATIHEKKQEIAFAGNLDKSAFVQHLTSITARAPGLIFHIYGHSTAVLSTNKNLFHHGTFLPRQLSALIKGAFGLIWDGDACDHLSGPYGNYLNINSPHKMSLYILAGLPVITAAHTANSAYIIKYNIGVTIHNLNELETVINSITPDQYQTMVSNMRPLALAISQGNNLLSALKELNA